jgi:broad specificity phosphatase PhoE
VTLFLVRHAMPEVNPGSDPATWPLGSAGLAAARALIARQPAAALLVASNEPKSWQTLDPDGERMVVRDHRLGEVRRRDEFSDDFRRARREYVSGKSVTGWEPQVDVASRFAAAVGEATRKAGHRDLVLASHGMAMTVWLTHAIALPDPGGFWACLLFPDIFAVDLSAGTIGRVAEPG